MKLHIYCKCRNCGKIYKKKNVVEFLSIVLPEIADDSEIIDLSSVNFLITKLYQKGLKVKQMIDLHNCMINVLGIADIIKFTLEEK